MKNTLKFLMFTGAILSTYGANGMSERNSANAAQERYLTLSRAISSLLSDGSDRVLNLKDCSEGRDALIAQMFSEMLLSASTAHRGREFRANVKALHITGSLLDEISGFNMRLVRGLDYTNNIVNVKIDDEKTIRLIAPAAILPDNENLYNSLQEIANKYDGFLPRNEVEDLLSQQSIQDFLRLPNVKPYVLDGFFTNRGFSRNPFCPAGTIIKIGENKPMQVIDKTITLESGNTINDDELYNKLSKIASDYKDELPIEKLLKNEELDRLFGKSLEQFIHENNLLEYEVIRKPRHSFNNGIYEDSIDEASEDLESSIDDSDETTDLLAPSMAIDMGSSSFDDSLEPQTEESVNQSYDSSEQTYKIKLKDNFNIKIGQYPLIHVVHETIFLPEQDIFTQALLSKLSKDGVLPSKISINDLHDSADEVSKELSMLSSTKEKYRQVCCSPKREFQFIQLGNQRAQLAYYEKKVTPMYEEAKDNNYTGLFNKLTDRMNDLLIEADERSDEIFHGVKLDHHYTGIPSDMPMDIETLQDWKPTSHKYKYNDMNGKYSAWVVSLHNADIMVIDWND